ncbi:MAG: hypothetical protein QOJ42_4044 [Acidobacteriaceae bacterium]|nr:hypothetical protein [Acidobacteriaceae bacterium]
MFVVRRTDDVTFSLASHSSNSYIGCSGHQQAELTNTHPQRETSIAGKP